MTLSSKFLLSMLLFSPHDGPSHRVADTQPHYPWVVSHLDTDDCVPVTHISWQGQHIYTEGPFKTPSDVLNWIGLPWELVPETHKELEDRMVDFIVHTKQGQDYHMLFFVDQDFCRATFGKMPR